MKIYFTTDENGYLKGWGNTPSLVEGEVSIEVEDDHEVLDVPEVFKYVDGELVKDEELQERLIRESQFRQSQPNDIERLELSLLELATIVLSGGAGR